MRIVILTAGSLGDVRPYVALGRGLRDAGFRVTVAGFSSFEPLVLQHGLLFHPLRNPFTALSRTEAWASWQASGGRPAAFARGLRRVLRVSRASTLELFDDAWRACGDADAVIYPTAGLGGPDIAEKRGIRGYWAHLYPVVRTGAFPCFAGPAFSRLGSVYNRFTYRVASSVYRRAFGPAVDTWRQQTLAMPPRARRAAFDPFVTGTTTPVLYGFSPALVPKPADWGAAHHVTGYWHLDAPEERAPAALDAFLRAGAPPIYINARNLGFDARLVQTLMAAVPRATGCRVIVQAGGDVDEHAGPEAFVTRATLPHDWLFPRVRAVVHHGGAGTVATVLRAGVPSLGVPAFFDQPFWSRRLAALGVAPPPLPRREATAERLLAALTQLAHDERLRERARDVARAVQRDSGVAAAVDVLSRDLARSREPSGRVSAGLRLQSTG